MCIFECISSKCYNCQASHVISPKFAIITTNIQNYDLSGATIRNTGLGVADGTVVISTGMFVRASISIYNSTTIEDISNNTVQGGVTQSVVKN